MPIKVRGSLWSSSRQSAVGSRETANVKRERARYI
jgi:hypothetical protein